MKITIARRAVIPVLVLKWLNIPGVHAFRSQSRHGRMLAPRVSKTRDSMRNEMCNVERSAPDE